VSAAPDRMARFRLWLVLHPEAKSLAVLALVGVLLLGSAALMLATKTYQGGERASGVIARLLPFERERGLSRDAIVTAPDGQTLTVSIPRTSPCRIGSAIPLVKQRQGSGMVYAPADGADCAS
jgi:hypothetical protein